MTLHKDLTSGYGRPYTEHMNETTTYRITARSIYTGKVTTDRRGLTAAEAAAHLAGDGWTILSAETAIAHLDDEITYPTSRTEVTVEVAA